MPVEPCLLILAAGFSRRFGSDKRRARLPNGRTLLDQALAIARASGVDYRLVLREDDELPADTAPSLKVANAERGMGQTIAEAVAQVPAGADAILLMPVDLACLAPATVHTIARRATRSSIVRPRCKGEYGESGFGHPVAFGRDFFPELIALAGDSGARAVINAHPEAVDVVEVADSGIVRDIDTPQALSEITAAELF